jgi:hypothetical protein
MAQAIDATVGVCPLCGQSLSLDLPDWRVGAKWRAALAARDKWGAVADEFRDSHSIEEAARRLSISTDTATLLLEFLCTEICGCRAVTCVTCLDDYRSAL